jgi:hypothetical protein
MLVEGIRDLAQPICVSHRLKDLCGGIISYLVFLRVPQDFEKAPFRQVNHPVRVRLQNVGNILFGQSGLQRLSLHLATFDGNNQVERTSLSKKSRSRERKITLGHFKTVSKFLINEKLTLWSQELSGDIHDCG